MEHCVSSFYLTYCMEQLCENLDYESVYFKELQNDQAFY